MKDGSLTLIIVYCWVFSHSSVDYTVTYSIKMKGWRIGYIDLQLESNIYFPNFPGSITFNLNNGCRWPRRVDGDKRVDDPNMIGVYCAMIKQCHWSDLPHCWNRMIRWSAQNIYSRIGTLAEWKDVFGGTRWVFVTKQNIGQHVTSFKIDDYKQCNE